MPAFPDVNVWPALAIAIVIAAAIGTLLAFLEGKLTRSARSAGPADDMTRSTLPEHPATSPTVLDQLAAGPEEPGDLRRSA
ncbi:MAG: hypothetical protein M3Q23_14935 [Actinomycetota bacterium]|nr:hypothetical protein [Actinomycetota bacterium]